MRKSLYDYSIEHNMEHLLDQWDREKNTDITPESISFGSKKKVWWRCGKGHEWQAMVYTRVEGNGCPVCSNRVAVPGINDFQTIHPELAKQWHAKKNGDLTPDQVLPGSHKKVWWRCSKGHEWQAQVKSRVSGCGCPVCTNRVVNPGENDLETTHPELALQWHPAKNGKLRPQDVVAGSEKKVWWICEKGHEWQATITARTSNNSGCHVCAGKVIVPGENDLASTFPDIAKYWHPEKNGDLTPEKVSPYSNRRVWWQCDLGHEWQTVIARRTKGGVGCPYCSGHRVLARFNDLNTRFPKVAAQWHPTLNGDLAPDQVTAGSCKRVWWQCEQGHVWKAIIYSRTTKRGTGCPVCAGKGRGKYQQRYSEALKEDQRSHDR